MLSMCVCVPDVPVCGMSGCKLTTQNQEEWPVGIEK
jgi:hypothetical protein